MVWARLVRFGLDRVDILRIETISMLFCLPYSFLYVFRIINNKHISLLMSEIRAFYLFIYLFIYGCVGSSFLCEGFFQLRRAGATLHRGARASHCRGLSHCGAQAPDAQAQ